MGCSSVDNREEIPTFPAQATLVGEALGNVEGLRIECAFDFVIRRLDEETPGSDELYAVLGGEAQRVVLDEEGAGIGLRGDAFDSVRIAFPRPDEIMLSSRLHEPSGVSRFWDELLRFEGRALAEDRWEGAWTCFPLDTREDTVGVVEGTWLIETADR